MEFQISKKELQDLKVSTKFIEKVKEKGCKHLNMRGSKIEGELKLTKMSKIESMNLFETEIDFNARQNLLDSTVCSHEDLRKSPN